MSQCPSSGDRRCKNPNTSIKKCRTKALKGYIRVVTCSSRYSIALSRCGGCGLCTKQISSHGMIEYLSRVVVSGHGSGGLGSWFFDRRRAGSIFSGNADILQASLAYFMLAVRTLFGAEGEACLTLMTSKGWLCSRGCLSGAGL